MNNNILTYGFLIVLLSVLQVSLFDNIHFLGYINPYVYPIFVFTYPFRKEKINLLLLSFLLGFLIDIMTNEGGIHAFSLVFIAYIRLPLLKLLLQKSTTDMEEIQWKAIPFTSLFLWILLLVFIHNILLFVVESYSFTEWRMLLKKSVLSTIISVFLIILGIQFFTKKTSHA